MEPNLKFFSEITRRVELPLEEKHKGEDIRTYKARQKALDALCDKAEEVIKAIPESPLSKQDIHDLGRELICIHPKMIFVAMDAFEQISRHISVLIQILFNFFQWICVFTLGIFLQHFVFYPKII